MKKIKLLTLVLCMSVLSFSNTVNAQIDATISPIGLLFGNFDGGVDFGISENMSVEVGLGLQFGNNNITGDTDYKYFGLPINVFGKYYLNPNNGADKFYVGAFAKFVTRSYSIDGDNSNNYAEYSNTRFGVGFGLGYKIVSNGGFVFDINFGAGRAFVDKNKFSDGDESVSIELPGLMVTGKLGIGYRFGGGSRLSK